MYQDSKGNQINALFISKTTDNSDVLNWVQSFGDTPNRYFVQHAAGIALRLEGGKIQTGHNLLNDKDEKYVSGDVIVRSSEPSYSILTQTEFNLKYTQVTDSTSGIATTETVTEDSLRNAISMAEKNLEACREVYKKNKSTANKESVSNAQEALQIAEEALDSFLED